MSDSSSGASRKGGVFANLIPQMEGLSDLETTIPDNPRAAQPETLAPEPVMTTAGEDEIFFEMDDAKSGFIGEKELSRNLNAQDKPAVRKVNPYEIPAGHVDLESGRVPAFAAEFDPDEPVMFVGRLVKGRYKVTEFLGDDEVGLTYLAEDQIVEDKKVLVRVLIAEEDDEIMRSILAEERVSLSHFSHPNIARLIDSGEFTGGTQFLVSEFVDALSVRDILDIHGGFSAERAGRVIRTASIALSEAHQEGILHRDVRPQNLVLVTDEAEQTMVVNFGASNGDPTPENMGYKAPEVLEGRVATAASDVFSLAVVAYEMLTNRLPFSGGTAKELLRSQSAEFSPAGLAPAVAEVLDRALSYKPADRYTKAREFGDAFNTAVTESPEVFRSEVIVKPASPAKVAAKPVAAAAAAAATTKPAHGADDPAWTRRSPEPPQTSASRGRKIALFAIFGVAAILILGLIYMVRNPAEQPVPTADANANGQSPVATGDVPPPPRVIPQPPNTNFYQNSKTNLRGDLLANFVGFSMYYPKDWKVNGPQAGDNPTARGKFLDIVRQDPEGRMREQMLISYYPSKGTFADDAGKFPQMVAETNETLKKLLPGYQMVSEGEIKFNGDWRAYEVKFQGGGTSPSGEKLVVWGRRLFVPAGRPGVRNGFEITMLATSYAQEVQSVDDVGTKGELAPILYSFEPGQNF
jgi:serine/threonine-protein kinase